MEGGDGDAGPDEDEMRGKEDEGARQEAFHGGVGLGDAFPALLCVQGAKRRLTASLKSRATSHVTSASWVQVRAPARGPLPIQHGGPVTTPVGARRSIAACAILRSAAARRTS